MKLTLLALLLSAVIISCEDKKPRCLLAKCATWDVPTGTCVKADK